MRLLVSGLWGANQPSGICRHTINLLRSIISTGAVRGLYLALGCWQIDYFERALGLNRLPVEVLPVNIARGAMARNFWYGFQLHRLAQRVSANIVHMAFPAPVLRAVMPCPLVTTIHDLYPYDFPSNFHPLRVGFNRMFLNQAIRASDRLVCVSDFTLARLRHHAPSLAQDKAERIYNSVHLEGSSTPPPGGVLHPDSPFILAVAQHRSNKNLPDLLRGFHAAKAFGIVEPNTRLVLVGSEGPETAHIVRLARALSLTDDLRLLSAVGDDELLWLYRNCRALISLSTIEGFGLPVAEAISCGARVLCSDIPIHREIGSEDCDFIDLARAARSHELAAAIGRVITRPLPSRKALHRFSPQAVGSAHVELYEKVLQSRAWRSATRPRAAGREAVFPSK